MKTSAQLSFGMHASKLDCKNHFTWKNCSMDTAKSAWWNSQAKILACPLSLHKRASDIREKCITVVFYLWVILGPPYWLQLEENPSANRCTTQQQDRLCMYLWWFVSGPWASVCVSWPRRWGRRRRVRCGDARSRRGRVTRGSQHHGRRATTGARGGSTAPSRPAAARAWGADSCGSSPQSECLARKRISACMKNKTKPQRCSTGHHPPGRRQRYTHLPVYFVCHRKRTKTHVIAAWPGPSFLVFVCVWIETKS